MGEQEENWLKLSTVHSPAAMLPEPPPGGRAAPATLSTSSGSTEPKDTGELAMIFKNGTTVR